MVCCPNCFAHEWLKERVREISTRRGACDFCRSEDVPVVNVRDLADSIHNLLSMYVEADSFESGEPLVDLVQWHWQVFDEDELSRSEQIKLLQRIANSDWDDDSGEPPINAKELYTPLGNTFHTTHRERWEEFCMEVREKPDEPLPMADYLQEGFAQLDVQAPAGTAFHRARRGFVAGRYGDRTPFRGDDISAPPPEKALPGRANVQGQRVLYCADQERTAVAEVRPPRGFYVSVATVVLKREARIFDLTKEIEQLNPFIGESLGWHVEIRSLLEAFGEEMSRPLERDDDRMHYIPCQKLADFIRDARYDGVRYPSALDPAGTNVVLFDPGIAEVTEPRLVRITESHFDYEVEQASVQDVAASADASEGAAAKLNLGQRTDRT